MLMTVWFVASKILCTYLVAQAVDPEVLFLDLTYGAGMMCIFEHFHEASFWPHSSLEVATQTIGMLMMYEIWFYHAHWLMHTRFLKRFHAVHHNHEMSPESSMRSHPIEYMLIFIGPGVVLPYLFQVSWFISWAWICLGTIKAARAHLPWQTNHYLHHTLGNVNYGTLDVLDWLYGTYAK